MSEKTIVVRRARLPFIKLRRGLIEGRHREAMGSAIWLYLYFHSIADRKQGVAAVDLQQASDELGVSQRSVRAMYTTLIDAEYLEPLRVDFEPATAQDRVAHRAPFVRITRYAEDPNGAQDARKESAGTRKKASASTRKKSSTSRKKSSTSRKISSGSRKKSADPSNRIADASEEAVEAVEAVEGGSAPPVAADQNPDQTQTAPPSDQPDPRGNGHPKPEAETPPPEPRATPGGNGQSLGQGNGQAPTVAERPPDPDVEFGDALDLIADACAAVTSSLTVRDRSAFAEVHAICAHPEPLRRACEQIPKDLEGVGHRDSAYRYRFANAVDTWRHAIQRWRREQNKPKPAPREPNEFEARWLALVESDGDDA